MNKISNISAKLLFVFATVSFIVSCTTYKRCPVTCIQQTIRTDSIIRNSVGDSIFTTLIKANEIKAISKDSTENYIRLNRTQRDILRFIITDVKNYESNANVYGKFVPSIQFKYSYKTRVYNLNFDLGLNKWQICDKNGKFLKQYDLKTNDMLRFSYLIFPDNDLINELIKLYLK